LKQEHNKNSRKLAPLVTAKQKADFLKPTAGFAAAHN